MLIFNINFSSLWDIVSNGANANAITVITGIVSIIATVVTLYNFIKSKNTESKTDFNPLSNKIKELECENENLNNQVDLFRDNYLKQKSRYKRNRNLLPFLLTWGLIASFLLVILVNECEDAASHIDDFALSTKIFFKIVGQDKLIKKSSNNKNPNTLESESIIFHKDKIANHYLLPDSTFSFETLIEKISDKGNRGVYITAYASPTGSEDYNNYIAIKRAILVANRLLEDSVNVLSIAFPEKILSSKDREILEGHKKPEVKISY